MKRPNRINNSRFISGFLILLILPALTCAQEREAEGPVARFSFNNGVPTEDLSQKKVSAYGLIPTEDRFGNANSAYFFQGNADSYLNLGTSRVLKPKQGTISLWVKIDQPIFKGTGIDQNQIIYTRSRIEED